MSQDLTLHQRRREPNADELAGIPWLSWLSDSERAQTVPRIVAGDAQAGDVVCRIGRAPTYWFGVIDGLLKMNIDTDKGDSLTFTGVSRGGWFGEGTALKREPYRYNVNALRASVVAGLPIDSFHTLLSESIGFNRFIMNQLNERLGQFIAAREIDRINNPDLRVARNLAALVNPVLFPGVGEVLDITQQELGYLVGLSRQRVNVALKRLEAAQWIKVTYGGIRILNLPALRSHTLSLT